VSDRSCWFGFPSTLAILAAWRDKKGIHAKAPKAPRIRW